MTLGHALKSGGREHWEQAHALFTAIGAPERSRTAALLGLAL
jgi:hypothetical protein